MARFSNTLPGLSNRNPSEEREPAGRGKTQHDSGHSDDRSSRMIRSDESRLASALDWYATMPEPALAMTSGGGAGQLSVRRYTGSPPEMHQPALSDNLLCIHLGGGKEVHRWHDGRKDVHSVELGALTIMPAHFSNRWLTRGPIDFIHLLLSSELVGQIALEEFNQDSNSFHLTDVVGFRDAHIESLFIALVNALENRAPGGRVYLDSLLVVIVFALIERYSSLAGRSTRDFDPVATAKGGLAPRRLRRVVDFMLENLDANIGLADLTALTNLSRAQFYRAFKQSTGVTPHRYLNELRLEAAKALLQQGEIEIAEIAQAIGVSTAKRFGALFRQRFGIGPKAYRKWLL